MALSVFIVYVCDRIVDPALKPQKNRTINAMSCCVKNCGNYYKKTKLLEQNCGNSIKYFSFPKDATIASKWLTACGKQKVNVKKDMICSQHFDASCFVQSPKEKFLFYSQKRLTKLKADAIPTLRLMFDAPQVEAHCDKRSLLLIDTSSKSEMTCNDTFVALESSDTVLPATFDDNISASQIHNTTELPSTSRNVTVLLEKLNSVEEQLAATQKKLLMYKEKDRKDNENMETRIHKILGKMFTPGQIRMILNPSKKRLTWSSEDIASAISLRSISPKAYRYLRNVLQIPLPGPSTLRRWASSVKVETGVISCVLECMKQKGKCLKDYEKLIVLTFDEVYLSNKIGIDRKCEQVIGPHKTCQCVMVRSLFSNWKQPVYYDFDKSMTKSTLLHVISEMYNIGYTVVAVTSDMGSGNMGLWSEIEIGIEKCFFQHPVCIELKVFVFADMPRLIKLVRNHFLNKEFNVNGVIVNKKCLERMLAINGKDLKVAYKISQYHLDLQGTERQKVLPAVQLLSANTASALQWCGQKGFLENVEWVETSRMIKLLNDWFDIFNSKSMYGNHSGKNAYGKNLEEQNVILHEMTSFMYELRVGSHKSLMLFQKGFIVSNNSLEQLLPYLIEKYPLANIEYVITNRLNQDVLENFFSFIRSNGGGPNDQPSALDFKYRIKRYILGKFSTITFCKSTNVTENERNVSCLISPLNDNNNNCEEYILSNMLAPYINEDETTNLHVELEWLTESESNKENCVPCFNSTTYIPTLEEEELLKSLDEIEIINKIENQGLLYIAGYVAYRFKSKYDTLGIQTCELPIVNDEEWLQFISRGKCMYPSSDLLKAAYIMNTEFSKYHGSKLRKDKFIFKKLADKIEIALKPIELPREVLLCLVRTRTYIRVREINRSIAVENRFKNKKKKLTKFTNNKSFS